ncbi:sensor histidine kinase [Bradyrhizobium sp. BTAi1]|uniref:sensor histidine kinase n=1 Tax=Bradyrhizobium sp. (strain BTAi1 / ATCC BAA-1182) TaxID=288000 RepID=UPI00005DDC2C|nr:ATP-binding protein [Bradyrhizobium sp. BTAi1]
MMPPHAKAQGVDEPNAPAHPNRARRFARPWAYFVSRLDPRPQALFSPMLPIFTAALAIAIFIFDTVTPYEIAAASLQVVVVLLSLRFCRKQGVIFVSLGCAALSILSAVLTIVSYVPTAGSTFSLGVINTSISLTAIAATAYLALATETARQTAERAQAHLAHVARLTTLGEISASIAHELNQPLTAVITNANAATRWIRSEPPNPQKVTSSIESIVEDARRASEIIARIRALTTRAEPQNAWVDINAVIQEVLVLIQSQLNENRIVVRAELNNGLPSVFGDRIQLQQAVLNLIVNAIDAIGAAQADPREIRIRSRKTRPSGVEVSIEDTGGGLTTTDVNQIFDAFFSTKTGGMGIGLSICRSIIEAHHGRIWAEKGEPSGATFHFTLPGTQEANQ